MSSGSARSRNADSGAIFEKRRPETRAASADGHGADGLGLPRHARSLGPDVPQRSQAEARGVGAGGPYHLKERPCWPQIPTDRRRTSRESGMTGKIVRLPRNLAQVEKQVRNGGGGMPSLADVLSDKEIDTVVRTSSSRSRRGNEELAVDHDRSWAGVS